MDIFKILAISLTLVALSSCQKEDELLEVENNDYMIFGHFYGECTGEYGK